MASAVLASSRNDSSSSYCWGGGEDKFYNSNSKPSNLFPINPNPNPNPNFHAIEGGDVCGYVRFNISALSRKELRELKRRLVSELDQVRSVTSRIESRSARSGIYSTCSSSSTAALLLRSQQLEMETTATAVEQNPMEEVEIEMVMKKECRQILTKMLKMKGCEWFKSPVDAVGMGLHDYHQVVKQPMDLGTVRSRLNKGHYASPLDFASDVRLTFNNALLYNPQGHEVHSLAALFLNFFDTHFAPILNFFRNHHPIATERHNKNHHPLTAAPAPPPSRMRAVDPPPAPTLIPPPPPPPKQQQPKPKPKPKKGKQEENNKSPRGGMSIEEKFELTKRLQQLPQEKMDHVLQIMNKRNVVTAQDGDEIELDFEVMDNDTLWELHRFVAANFNFRQHGKDKYITSLPPAHHHPPHGDGKSATYYPSGETAAEAVGSKKSRKGEAPCPCPCEDDDVDIIGDGDGDGNEMPPSNSNYPSLEIEKDSGGGNNSSATDSSSSTGSDSGSSSAATDSDSEDDDDAHSSPPLASAT